MSITIENYTDYSIVVRGDTKKFKKHLLDLEGKFNPNLKVGGAGWIFKKKDKELVEKLQSDIKSGKITASEENEEGEVSERPSRKAAVSSSSSSTPNEFVLKKEDYLALLSRIERLENICSRSPFVQEDSSSKKSSPNEIEFEDEVDTVEEEDDRAAVGLLRKKKVSEKTTGGKKSISSSSSSSK